MSKVDNAMAARDAAHFKKQDRDEAITEDAYERWDKMIATGSVEMRDGKQAMRWKLGIKERFPGSRCYDNVTLDDLASELGLTDDLESCHEHDLDLPENLHDRLFTLFCQKLEKHYELESIDDY